MNPNNVRANAIALRELHHGPKILVLPNAWDCLSARLFEQAGFSALATTSGGIAAVLGYPDGQLLSAREMLRFVGRIAATVSAPVTADLEAGYGTTVAQIVETMGLAIAAGVAGANLEDSAGPEHRLADLAYQVEVIQAIRAMAESRGVPFVLNARIDVYLHGAADDAGRFKETVRRAQGYHAAGADCVFPIGLKDRETIARLVSEIGCPMNIMAGPGAPTIAEMEQLGVARVSFGTGLMRAGLPSIRQMARELRASGSCELLSQTEFTHATVNQLFEKQVRVRNAI
jgi:2-methylisocitrate lyase-like PEP mutase family enzyme